MYHTSTREEKARYIWRQALENATGAGHLDPWAYADKRVIEILGPPPRKAHKRPSYWFDRVQRYGA